MDSESLQEKFEVALDDLDKEKVENGKLKFKLRRVECFIKKLKEQLEISRNQKSIINNLTASRSAMWQTK